MKYMRIFFLLVLCFCLKVDADQCYDLTVVGFMNPADGLGRQPIDLINCLGGDLKINFVPTRKFDASKLPQKIKDIACTKYLKPGIVAILEDALWYPFMSPVDRFPDSFVKISYSMLEGTEIPSEWVQLLNSTFDLVVVPDPFLIEVYQNSGVTIPIFFLPLGVALENYLKMPKKIVPQTPFVFGSSGSFDERKNHVTLIQAFAEEFGNSPDVILRLNGRQGRRFTEAQELIASLGVSNIYLTKKVLPEEEYIAFMVSLDCYANLSKGEGFSICPREALALGIPCVLTDNSAQTTICNTGFVRAVPSMIPEPATYDGTFGRDIGLQFNCSVADARAAMRDVYTNYSYYLGQAGKGREWVQQYLWKNLKCKYMNLVKPKEVILGNRNEITVTYFMTNSPQLYSKYTKIGKRASLGNAVR